MKVLNSNTYIDTETGEIIELKEGQRAVVLNPLDSVYTKNQKEYYIKMMKRREDKTEFIWAYFTYDMPYFKYISLSSITRMLYLATYYRQSNGFLMYKQDVKTELNISCGMASNLISELQFRNVIALSKGAMFINTDMFSKGTAKKLNHTRVFVETVRMLYKSCNSISEHKSLGYIFKMMPYLNRQSNILSHTVQEQDINPVSYISFSDFCEIVGYDKSHAQRLRNKLQKFRIDGELAVGFFDNISELTEKGEYVIVNPRLLYGGDRTQETYKSILRLFSIEKTQHFVKTVP